MARRDEGKSRNAAWRRGNVECILSVELSAYTLGLTVYPVNWRFEMNAERVYYKSVDTGEITESRGEAAYWYEANGDTIEYWKYGRKVAEWRHN